MDVRVGLPELNREFFILGSKDDSARIILRTARTIFAGKTNQAGTKSVKTQKTSRSGTKAQTI